MSEKPRYTHECECCTFLGRYDEYDLYHCTQSGIPTVLARYGNKGPEYLSGMMFNTPPLVEAKFRCFDNGLLPRI